MINYYENLLKQYQNVGTPAPIIQKTPEQIAQEQKEGTYQIFMSTKEGIEAIADLRSKFEVWYDDNYTNKSQAASNKKLEDMILALSSEIKELKGLNQSKPNQSENNNTNRKN